MGSELGSTKIECTDKSASHVNVEYGVAAPALDGKRSSLESCEDKYRSAFEGPSDSSELSENENELAEGKSEEVSSDYQHDVRRNVEGVSEAEIAEQYHRAEKYYDAAEVVARTPDSNGNGRFESFSEHTETHAREVTEKVAEACDALNATLDAHEGLLSSYVKLSTQDKAELQTAGIWHDTGMDGGTLSQGDSEKAIRKNHSVESAIHVLENRAWFEERGLNPDRIAVDCASHSKSCFGKDSFGNKYGLTQEGGWEQCFDSIQRKVDLYNEQHPGNPIEFHRDIWQNTNGSFNEFELKRAASRAVCMRAGDAFGHDGNDMQLQSGETRSVDLGHFNVAPENSLSSTIGLNYELENNRAFRTSEDGCIAEITDEAGKRYAFGESNLNAMYSKYTDGKFTGTIEVKNGNVAPCCTQACIDERIGEFKSMSDLPREIDIVLPENTSDDMRNFYNKFADVRQDNCDFTIKIR